MRNVMRAVIGLVGLFNLGIGLGFLLAPQKLAAGFFIIPLGTQGLATLRADFPGFFIGAAVFTLIAARRGEARPLLVPIVIIGLALLGRCLSLAADGTPLTALPPMLVETLMLVLLALAYRQFSTGDAP